MTVVFHTRAIPPPPPPPETITLANTPGPRIACYYIDPSSSNYTSSADQQLLAYNNIVIWNTFLGLEGDMGTSMSAVMATVKNYALTNYGVSLEAFLYVMSTEQSFVGESGNGDTYTIWSATVNDAPWWPYNPWNDGTGTPIDGPSADSGALNMCTANTIIYNGLSIWSSYWNHYDKLLRLGEGASLGYSSGIPAANTAMTGFFLDNYEALVPQVADWLLTGTTQSSVTTAMTASMQTGLATLVTTERANWGAGLIAANSNYYLFSTTGNSHQPQVPLQSARQGLLDVAFRENLAGSLYSETTELIWTNYFKAAAAEVNATGCQIMGIYGGTPSGWSSQTQADWTSGAGGDWQAARKWLCWTHIFNWYLQLGGSSTGAIFLMDEFGQPTLAGRQYAGTPPTPPIAAVYNGVWVSVWPGDGNGPVAFVWNPANNGVQSPTLADLGLSGTWYNPAHLGYGDTAISTGTSVGSSITLQDGGIGDGRVLLSWEP